MNDLVATDQWETPDDLFRKLDKEFNFTLDLCSTPQNSRCLTGTDDIESLSDGQNEYSTFWMNPPYSRGNIDKCMKKAVDLVRSNAGSTLVTLTRFDPSARWFRQYVDGSAHTVRMLNKRIKFKGAKDSYNFPCCVSIYNDNPLIDPTDYYIWGWK